jgi:hypothetical protein
MGGGRVLSYLGSCESGGDHIRCKLIADRVSGETPVGFLLNQKRTNGVSVLECRVQKGKELNGFQRNLLDIEVLSNLRFGSLEIRVIVRYSRN